MIHTHTHTHSHEAIFSFLFIIHIIIDIVGNNGDACVCISFPLLFCSSTIGIYCPIIIIKIAQTIDEQCQFEIDEMESVTKRERYKFHGYQSKICQIMMNTEEARE